MLFILLVYETIAPKLFNNLKSNKTSLIRYNYDKDTNTI